MKQPTELMKSMSVLMIEQGTAAPDTSPEFESFWNRTKLGPMDFIMYFEWMQESEEIPDNLHLALTINSEERSYQQCKSLLILMDKFSHKVLWIAPFENMVKNEKLVQAGVTQFFATVYAFATGALDEEDNMTKRHLLRGRFDIKMEGGETLRQCILLEFGETELLVETERGNVMLVPKNAVQYYHVADGKGNSVGRSQPANEQPLIHSDIAVASG